MQHGGDTLLAIADVLVFKALETLGKRLVKRDRSRFRYLGYRPMYEAHTIWDADERDLKRSLSSSWDILPILLRNHEGCCRVEADDISDVLDDYVIDLCKSKTPHSIESLSFALFSTLGPASCALEGRCPNEQKL